MTTLQLDDVELVIEAHKLAPGDIFVVHLPVGYSLSNVVSWERTLRECMPKGVTLLLLPPDYDIEVYRGDG